MQGWLKVARKKWPDCIVMESPDQMEVRAKNGDLLVMARRDGSGAVHCAQKDSGAKHSLAVLQSEKNPDDAKYGERCEPKSDAPVPAASQA